MSVKSFAALVFFLLLANVHASDLELKVVKTEKVVSLAPSDKIWKKVKPLELPLLAQMIAPPGGGGSVKKIWIQSLKSKEKIYFRLEWEDATVNENPAASQSFTDAAAIQFPENPGAWPSPFMGDSENPVMIWRWSASAEADDAAFRTGEGAGNIVSKRTGDNFEFK